MMFKKILPAANIVACSLFLLLRAPAPIEYLTEVDEARQRGAVVRVGGIVGTLACRNLYSWSEWHGGEALGVKVLEVINLPALVSTAAVGLIGEFGLARTSSACRWSWLLAGVFVLIASAQWWLLGFVIDRHRRRLSQKTEEAA
jgi:hypothetical protein